MKAMNCVETVASGFVEAWNFEQENDPSVEALDTERVREYVEVLEFLGYSMQYDAGEECFWLGKIDGTGAPEPFYY